jgi:predicted DNA-binding transcriptional regulator YafY
MNRLFEITYLLLNKKTVTAKELAEHFGVSQRTIYRDVDALDLAGIPVYTEKGKGGGIGLLPDFVLNKSILNEREQHEILSALKGLSGITNAETGKVLEKLSAVFNKNAVNWLEVDYSGWKGKSDTVFNDLKTAILERRIVEFDYYGTNGEKKRRCIEPVLLWFKSSAWYVKGFCRDRQEMRLFKLTRVKNLFVTARHFPARDIKQDTSIFDSMVNEKKMVNFKFKIAPELAYRVYDDFDTEKIEKQADGSFIASIKWHEDDWVYGFILSYGAHIEVLEPKRLRKIIREKSQKIVKKYL